VKGNYKINEHSIIFTDTEGPIACENSVHGEYKFTYNNEKLEFKDIQDACVGRKNLAVSIWKELNE